MEYEVRITLQAQAHLREIRDYIAQKLLAPEAAKSTVQRLGTVMASLSQMPKRVPLVEEEPWRSEGVRVRAVRNFLIFIDQLEKAPASLEEWDSQVWSLLLEKGTVNRDGSITFEFRNGKEIKVEAK